MKDKQFYETVKNEELYNAMMMSMIALEQLCSDQMRLDIKEEWAYIQETLPMYYRDGTEWDCMEEIGIALSLLTGMEDPREPEWVDERQKKETERLYRKVVEAQTYQDLDEAMVDFGWRSLEMLEALQGTINEILG